MVRCFAVTLLLSLYIASWCWAQPADSPPTKPGHPPQPAASQPAKSKKDSARPKKAATKPRPEAAKPNWIWRLENDRPAGQVWFRKEIVVQGSVSAARLYATCDNIMTIYLDGEKIVTHDDFTQPVFRDVTRFFETPTPDGRHVIAVEGENVGDDNPAGLLLKLDFESGWRAAWSEVTDASWQTAIQMQDGWTTNDFRAAGWTPAAIVAALGGEPWARITATTLAAAAPLKEPTATPIEALKVAKDFRVELLYSVPKDLQGSWVSLCVDPRGRLLVSDQYGGLYRITPPPLDSTEPIRLEKIPVDIGEAQGLLWAFDSLYVVVNRGQKYDSGLYRVRDTDGDDQLDSLELLRKLDGGAEHGPHAILPAPDGQSLVIVCGNNTALTEIEQSRVPRIWDEDLLLPRPYGKAFMKGKPAPGGYICRLDPDGKNWELLAAGFRNQYDAAFNADGELFTFDADMEWDMNTPWYRPTRVCHVISGAEFGWRNNGGKWPVYYADSLPPVVDVGPGSPTGICFGYGAKFPATYQRALFISDWSYGKLYAVHLEPQGASYRGRLEEFVTGTPLPLTDVVINPQDGAMYVAIGGRRVQSGLYRVSYIGSESTAPADARQADGAEARDARRALEARHGAAQPDTVDAVWSALGDSDRFIRFAARTALEHQPVETWQARALTERDPQTALAALLALARQHRRSYQPRGDELDTPPPLWDGSDRPQQTPEREMLLAQMLAALERLDAQPLTAAQRLELLRVYTLTFLRLGPPSEKARQKLIGLFDSRLPAPSRELNSELAQLLVYLQAPTAAEKIVRLLESAPTQEEQIDLAKTLRHLRVGWNPALQEAYFRWFIRAAGYRGGASFALFVHEIKNDAVAKLSPEDHQRLQPILDAKPVGPVTPLAVAPRPFVKDWQMSELVSLLETGLRGRDFDHGRKMFAATNCFGCHRFDNEGGAVGPDLTALAGRFSPRDILESIVDPDKTISDQYAAVTVITLDGKIVTGRIVNLAGDSIRINTNMLDPDEHVGVDRRQIDEMFPSKTSMMPKGLLNTLNETEVLDLMAYLLSRGDRNAALFTKTAGE